MVIGLKDIKERKFIRMNIIACELTFNFVVLVKLFNTHTQI